MNLSENFTLQELIYSDTAIRMGIDNKPNDETVENLKILCENILEPVRANFKAPVVVSSGYRSEAVCLAVGSSSKSQHIKGQAVDFEIFGIPNKEKGFNKNNSNLPSVASDFGETLKPFPNSEVFAIVQSTTGSFFTCPLVSMEMFIGLYRKNSLNTCFT